MLTVLAPAKINLTLEVLAERQDGFHEIRSVMQAVDLCDSLRLRSGQSIEFKCDAPGWVAGESLLSRAVGLLQESTGCAERAVIGLAKRIPLVSGLGGDTSDAVAALRGLNQLWGLGLSPRELAGLASKLGSDGAFFLHGGTALVAGRGEVVTPLPPLPRMWAVIMMPPLPRMQKKTGQLYASLRRGHYTDGQITARLVESLKSGEEFTSLLFNTFENVAFNYFPELSVYREHIIKAGASDVHLAGSGPALFTLMRDRLQAEEIYIRLQRQGLEVYLAGTLDGIGPGDA
ncbi:MAG: 4-(cytidine 5'-diphospho)-2-C-methyl-D-erythritol kinase [Chloroflexota bacterium]|nr:4-(cytidine 5'-diphospho)-2-C-methyl-D-erythritol kinase [Chloroflexota bacterium]